MGSFTSYNMCMCIYVCIYTYMELGHIFKEADTSQDLQSASWRPKRANSVSFTPKACNFTALIG